MYIVYGGCTIWSTDWSTILLEKVFAQMESTNHRCAALFEAVNIDDTEGTEQGTEPIVEAP